MYVANECTDSMANWDEKKLEEVVDKKHGERNKSLPKTDIVSLENNGCINTKLHIRCNILLSISTPTSSSILSLLAGGVYCETDLQVLSRCGGKQQIRLVLGMSKRRSVSLQARATTWLYAQEGQKERG